MSWSYELELESGIELEFRVGVWWVRSQGSVFGVRNRCICRGFIFRVSAETTRCGKGNQGIAVSGSKTVNVVPCPILELQVMRPLYWFTTMSWTVARPSPLPGLSAAEGAR